MFEIKLTVFKFLTVISMLVFMSSSSFAEIYKWKDESGKVHFSDTKPKTINATTIDLKINSYTNATLSTVPVDQVKKITQEKPGATSVVMYSTQWCGYCKKARAHMNSRNIPYVDYDIEQDAQANARYKALGGNGVPVLVIGEQLMKGFDQGTFDQLYNH